jgi:hypothetical protein
MSNPTKHLTKDRPTAKEGLGRAVRAAPLRPLSAPDPLPAPHPYAHEAPHRKLQHPNLQLRPKEARELQHPHRALYAPVKSSQR